MAVEYEKQEQRLMASQVKMVGRHWGEEEEMWGKHQKEDRVLMTISKKKKQA